jgi:hypothetical protein
MKKDFRNKEEDWYELNSIEYYLKSHEGFTEVKKNQTGVLLSGYENLIPSNIFHGERGRDGGLLN